MLLFIRIAAYHQPAGPQFKYISCYCLSCLQLVRLVSFLLFKYISCYCLSPGRMSRPCSRAIQIHLMLLFIQPRTKWCSTFQTFKYISCYCLSLDARQGNVLSTNSNTSHVIVYLDLPLQASHSPPFKYISCYCLSPSARCGVVRFFNSNTSHVIVYRSPGCGRVRCSPFKYISCYCLSKTWKTW